MATNRLSVLCDLRYILVWFGVDGRLRWTRHGGTDSLSHNNLFRFDSVYDELIVQSSGTYFVYLQLTYNGRTRPNVVYVSTGVRVL